MNKITKLYFYTRLIGFDKTKNCNKKLKTTSYLHVLCKTDSCLMLLQNISIKYIINF